MTQKCKDTNKNSHFSLDNTVHDMTQKCKENGENSNSSLDSTVHDCTLGYNIIHILFTSLDIGLMWKK